MALLEEFKQWENGDWTHNGLEFSHDLNFLGASFFSRQSCPVDFTC